MGDEQGIVYDRDQLGRSGDGVVTAQDTARSQLDATQAKIDGFGQWWNPNNDQNDLIGGLVGAGFMAAHQQMMSTGHQNLDVLHDHGKSIQALANNNQKTEDANTDVSRSIEARYDQWR